LDEFIVGRSGRGTLNIMAGGSVASGNSATIGYDSGSAGVVTVDGGGSTWSSFAYLLVGEYGSGTLAITGGGTVSNRYDGSIGHYSGSIGFVTVDGPRSTWSNTLDLFVGENGLYPDNSGIGTLSVTGGAFVTARNGLIGDYSLLAIDVGHGSQLNVGSGGITNNGEVRILAGAGPAPGGRYAPIVAGTWGGSGVTRALGGAWDDAQRVFTVSQVAAGTSGTVVALDLVQVQRALISEPEHDWSVGASLLAKTGSATQVNFTATAVSGDALAALQTALGPGQELLGAWQLSAEGAGYSPGDPVYLSFDVGSGYSRSELRLWDYDGTNWTAFDASDLTYNQPYASFTVTALGGYAVSAVPEPGSLVLLGVAVIGLLLVSVRGMARPSS
jgi:T5SS/PEP-CTERM-associated repeat protein